MCDDCVENGCVFGVGNMIGDVGEVVVWFVVGSKDFNVFKIICGECGGNIEFVNVVEWRVDDF